MARAESAIPRGPYRLRTQRLCFRAHIRWTPWLLRCGKARERGGIPASGLICPPLLRSISWATTGTFRTFEQRSCWHYCRAEPGIASRVQKFATLTSTSRLFCSALAAPSPGSGRPPSARRVTLWPSSRLAQRPACCTPRCRLESGPALPHRRLVYRAMATHRAVARHAPDSLPPSLHALSLRLARGCLRRVIRHPRSAAPSSPVARTAHAA